MLTNLQAADEPVAEYIYTLTGVAVDVSKELQREILFSMFRSWKSESRVRISAEGFPKAAAHSARAGHTYTPETNFTWSGSLSTVLLCV